MNIAQAKCIPIPSYLERQGIKPQKSTHQGRELWYHSPIRQNDENPSFKVDTIKNIWFDHGAATGGNIVKLVQEICACDVRDALQHLDKTGLYSPALAVPQTSSLSKSPSKPHLGDPNSALKSVGEKEKMGGLELISSAPLKHPALLQYLRLRNINHDVAQKYCSQIDFKPPQSDFSYFAIGYPSGNGFEARNALFKGFVGTGKSITIHEKNGANCLQIFEGFMDFLSYLSHLKKLEPIGTVIVLNSTNLWRHAFEHINNAQFDEVRLYLDNDAAGDSVTSHFLNEAKTPSKIQDKRSHYKNFADLNDWLV